MCLQTSQHRRRAIWLNRELLLQLRGKKKVYDLWKKEQTYQEEYSNVSRSYTDKTGKAEVQLYVAITVKNNFFFKYSKNKRCFYKHINNKRRAKENLQSLLDIVWSIVTKDEEEGEVLNVFVSVFNRKTSYSQLFDLVTWTGSRIQEEVDGDLPF